MIPATAQKEDIKPRKLIYDLSPKKLSSTKQIEILEKFNDSLQTQLEKAKKSIENLSFKNTENCTFEDFRDSQFKSAKKSSIKIQGIENISDNIRHHHHHKNDHEHNKYYKRNVSSKFNNLLNKKNSIVEIKNRSNSSKKSNVNNKNAIIENDFEDIMDGEEQKAALDRLNKAFERFGKEKLDFNE